MTSSNPASLSLENADIVKQVVSFVETGQFRFIASISKTFHEAYTDKFPDDTTSHMDVSTLTLTKFCLDDYLLVANTGNCRDHQLELQICKSAVKRGDLTVLSYLRSNKCWRNDTPLLHAAQTWNLEVLKWAHQNTCFFEK